jgi:hypothetical protein
MKEKAEHQKGIIAELEKQVGELLMRAKAI